MPLTTQPQKARYDRALGLTSCPVLHGSEKAAQTYKKGAFLIDDDAGRIAETTSPIDASAVGNRTFGLALDDATGTTDADVAFVWLGPNTIIEITLSNGTAGTHTLVIGDMWAVYPITKGTANWYLDTNAVSDTGGGIVVGFKDAIGTVDARVYAILTNTARGGKDAGSGTF